MWLEKNSFPCYCKLSSHVLERGQASFDAHGRSIDAFCSRRQDLPRKGVLSLRLLRQRNRKQIDIR